MLSVMARVMVSGQWDETVDIRCCATDDDPIRMTGPSDHVGERGLLNQFDGVVAVGTTEV